MSKITTIVNNIISKVNEHTTDVLALETLNSNHINLSGVTAYHLLQGNLAVSNSIITQGFNTTLYTSGSATTGIDMNTQWGNTSEERFGGLVWLKDRVEATNNFLYDTIRGATNEINSNTTEAAATLAGGLTAFNSTGFTVGADTGHNSTTNNMVSWNFQTTHRVTGTTNHGQAYECHYNPFTGFTMVKYTGSGIAGHEIPHHLGRKLGFATVKNLVTGSSNWLTCSDSTGYGGGMQLNTTGANNPDASNGIYSENTFLGCKTGDWQMNSSGSSYIAYGWANSYFDKSNKLIGNYEIGVYQGTGVSGNKVSTRGKPAWVMIKRLDYTSGWLIFDNQRLNSSDPFDAVLFANASDVEGTGWNPTFHTVQEDGFTMNTEITGDRTHNASGGQYLYMVAYDTNANGGGTYYPLASDTATLQVNNALIPIAQGIDSNGAKNTILSKNETFSGVTYTQGKNYPYYDALGNRGVSNKAPNYGTINPANGGDFYNVLSNKWYTSTGVEITNGRNYLNHIVYADNDGGVLYVEELPKIEYKDIIKANEFKGKNACTAWVNFDGTTTPPTIRDSYNVSAVIRTTTGSYDVYFKEPMDNINYGVFGTSNNSNSAYGSYVISGNYGYASDGRLMNKVSILVLSTNALYNPISASIQIMGGKN